MDDDRSLRHRVAMTGGVHPDPRVFTVGDGGVLVHRSGHLRTGITHVPFGCCPRPGDIGEIAGPGGEPVMVTVYGWLEAINMHLTGDLEVDLPPGIVDGLPGVVLTRGASTVSGVANVREHGYILTMVEGQEAPQQSPRPPRLTVLGGDLVVHPGGWLNAYALTGAGTSYGSGIRAVSTPNGELVNHGLMRVWGDGQFTTRVRIDTPLVNHGDLTTTRNGLELDGVAGTVHENHGRIVVGDREHETFTESGGPLVVHSGVTLANTGEVVIDHTRTASGHVTNTEGGTVTDTRRLTSDGPQVFGFAGAQQVLVGVAGGTFPRDLTMVWHGEDPPDADMGEGLEGTGSYWRFPFEQVGEPIAATAGRVDDPGPVAYSLTLPRLNLGDPQVCARVNAPVFWECLPTVVGQQVATTSGLDSINGTWAVSVVLECDPFTDVTITNPFCFDIDWMADEGLSTGYADGSYRPGATITRQALAAFLWRLAGSPEPASGAPTFGDVPPGHPFFEAISWLAGEGITTGFDDGTFRPGGSVTRQAMGAFMWRMVGSPAPGAGAPTFSDVGESHPFREAISWLAEVRIAEGFADETFRPGNPITRQAMAAFVRRYSVVVPA